MNFRIAVCDDSVLHNDMLLKLIRTYAEEEGERVQIDVFYDGTEFVLAAERFKYDIAFLDIEMPRMAGIEAGRIIRRSDPKMVLIYVTNYTGFTMSAYELEAIGYITKPMDVEKLNRLLEQAFSIVRDRSSRHYQDLISIKSGYETVTIRAQEIIYLNKYQNAVYIHMKNGKLYKWYNTIKNIADLLDARYFIEIYRGCLINIRYIYEFAEDSILLKYAGNLEYIPVSRRKLTMVKKLYYKRLQHV